MNRLGYMALDIELFLESLHLLLDFAMVVDSRCRRENLLCGDLIIIDSFGYG